MGKQRYEMPTTTFPYKISWRLALMSLPRRTVESTDVGMPAVTSHGVRRSALNAQITERINDAAYPNIRRCLQVKHRYKHLFSEERLERFEHIIEATNSTQYAKLGNCNIDLKKQNKECKKKKGWSDTDWKKHMEYINTICVPKKEFPPEPIKRGKSKPLEEFIARLKLLTLMPEYKVYKRLSQEAWYRDPIKVQPNAKKYVASERIKKLAQPKVIEVQD